MRKLMAMLFTKQPNKYKALVAPLYLMQMDGVIFFALSRMAMPRQSNAQQLLISERGCVAMTSTLILSMNLLLIASFLWIKVQTRRVSPGSGQLELEKS